VNEPGLLRRVDWILLAAVAALVTLGYLTVSSATRTDIAGDPSYYASRELLYFGAGAVVGVSVAMLDLRRLRAITGWLYGITLALLVVVLALGTASAARGSSRWIPLPFFDFQVSEMGKVVMIVCLAAWTSAARRRSERGWGPLLSTGLRLAPALALVFAEPDLGTSIVYGGIWLSILFVSGVPARQVVTTIVLAATIAVLVVGVLPSRGIEILQPYQHDRLTAFVDPSSTSATAYQQRESRIAIGAGGLQGRGANGATQTNRDFLPEHHTDFVFAVVGEQRGFLGAGIVLALFSVVFWRAARIIARAGTHYEALIAAGVFGMLLLQAFVNIGMTLGIMPVTGIPLPFLTYGGANTITNMAAIGLLLAVYSRSAAATASPRVVRASAARAERARRAATLDDSEPWTAPPRPVDGARL
jgi:rod shape determining protein RodA